MQSEHEIAILIIIGTGIVSGLVLTVLYFVIKYQKKVLQHRVQLQKIELARQLEVFTAAIEGEERQKQSIASDLHDGVISQLAIVESRISNFLEHGGSLESITKEMCESRKMLKDGISNIRGACFNLVPTTLRHLGLVKALEHLMFNLDSSMVFNARITVEDAVKPICGNFSSTTCLNIYRIIQELVNNIRKHSNSTIVNLTISQIGPGIRFLLRYNGVGISNSQVEELSKTGLGLSSIASRALVLKAEVKFEASVDGNLTSLVVPL